MALDATKFTVEIDLGNAAMLSNGEIAIALQRLADRLIDNYGFETAPMNGAGGHIADSNGNRVGKWSAA